MPRRRLERKPPSRRQWHADMANRAALQRPDCAVILSAMTQAQETKFDVAVVGGGATGFAAALAAAIGGLSTVVFAPPARFPPGRTAALLQGSIDVLSELGVWPQLSLHAAPLRAIRLVDATGRLVRAPEATFYAGEIGLTAFGYNIPNGDAGRRARAARGSLRRPEAHS